MLIRRKAFFIDAGYTVRDGKPYVALIVKGKKKAVKLYYQYDPYFLVEAPAERMNDLLAAKAMRKDGGIATPLRAEAVVRRSGLG